MRERLAIGLSIVAVTVLAALSLVFARIQNPADGLPAGVAAPGDPALPTAPAPPAATAPVVARGRAVLEAQGCLRCHAVAGVGNMRAPLDGVGARRDAAGLHAWTVGTPALADSLPASVFRAKQGYQTMPAGEMEALIGYLGSLTDGG
jgi:hypothetical protein